MLRHVRTAHEDDAANDEDSSEDSKSGSDDSDMEMSSEETEENIDPWIDIIEYAFKTLQPQFDEAAS